MVHWLKQLFATRKPRTIRTIRKDRRRFRPWAEALEDRLAPAFYDWNNAANTLAIQLATNESLTVSESAGVVSFALSSGPFVQSGPDMATGDGSPTISINSSDLVSSYPSIVAGTFWGRRRLGLGFARGPV